jgi:hypothetical protein
MGAEQTSLPHDHYVQFPPLKSFVAAMSNDATRPYPAITTLKVGSVWLYF